MLVLIYVITEAGAEGTHPLCLISGLIFHFIAYLSISNNTNGSICMTGFVTWQIRCQTRLNITPAHYHNQPSNECGRWCERLGWIRENGFSTLPSGGWVTGGLNRGCGPSGSDRGAPRGGGARALWCWQDKATQATHKHAHFRRTGWESFSHSSSTQTTVGQHLRTAYSCVFSALNTNAWGYCRG